MSHLLLDASAVVKRYLAETGSSWLRRMLDPATGNQVILAEITLAEVAAALARRARAPRGITLVERDQLLKDFLDHCDTEYSLVAVDRVCIDQAVLLTQAHALRGYDAVQLSAALTANTALVAANLPPLTFVVADDDLLAAARAEGLATENPNHHP